MRACNPLVSGAKETRLVPLHRWKTEARSDDQPVRAHAASEPRSWASNRELFINAPAYQPGELIRATPLWLSKVQLDSKANLVSPPVHWDFVEPPVCSCLATAFSGLSPPSPSSPKLPFL